MNLYKKELFRKSIHMCTAFVALFLKFWYWPVIIFLAVMLVLYLISEILRKNGIKVPVIAYVTETAARQKDEGKIVFGPVMLVLGVLVCALFLPYEPAAVGILALAFGDGLASLVGKCFGKIKIPFTGGKTVAGSSACFIAVLLTSFLVTKKITVSLIVAFTATVIEALPLGDFDNLVIPAASGFIAFLLLKIGM